MGDITTHVVQVAVLLGAVGVIARVVLGVHRAARRIEDTFSLVNKELRPNGGSSIHDAIKRIDARVEVLERLDKRGKPRRETDQGETL